MCLRSGPQNTLARGDYRGSLGVVNGVGHRQNEYWQSGNRADQANRNTGWSALHNLSATNSQYAGVFGMTKVSRLAQLTDGTSNTIAVAESHNFVGGPGNNGTQRPNYARISRSSAWATPFSAVCSMNKKINAYTNGNRWQDQERAGGLQSTHTGGAHALMADGTVKFLNQSMAYSITAALATRAGGETVGAF
mgnify:CR=1 FL=1